MRAESTRTNGQKRVEVVGDNLYGEIKFYDSFFVSGNHHKKTLFCGFAQVLNPRSRNIASAASCIVGRFNMLLSGRPESVISYDI